MSHTRRDWGKAVLAGLSATGWVAEPVPVFADSTSKPNSRWGGVQIGMNVPYAFGTRTGMTGEETLERCLQLGVSQVELRSQAIEKSFGVPDNLVLATAPSDGLASLTPDALVKYNATAADLRKWRLSVPMSKARDLRAKYEQAGVAIGQVKFDGFGAFTGDELDYAFTVTKALGARCVSAEFVLSQVKHVGEGATRHRFWVGLHGSDAVRPAMWEEAFSYSKYNGANVDIGMFVAGNNYSPLPFIEKYHDRMTHIHIRDRKKNLGPSVDLGQGDTPVKEILQSIRDHKWPIPATLDFDVPIAPGKDRMAELREWLDYCKQCLLS